MKFRDECDIIREAHQSGGFDLRRADRKGAKVKMKIVRDHDLGKTCSPAVGGRLDDEFDLDVRLTELTCSPASWMEADTVGGSGCATCTQCAHCGEVV